MTMPRLASSRWWYIMPIVFVTYSLAYLDRANYGFAAASGMADDLRITPGLSSLLGALFFLGYFFFQVPGAIYAEKRSVKKLIFVSLILWGGLATLTGMVANVYLLIGIRFLLGVVEAAVMPAMLVYLCHWFTRAERSRANTFLILGNPVTILWMSVVSGYLVEHFSWRWMFIIEGLPAVIWAFIWWRLVDDRPRQAAWLSGSEKRALEDALAAEQQGIKPVKNYREAFRSPKVIVLSLQYFCWSIGVYGFVLWLPSILKHGANIDIIEAGWLSALPYLAAVIAMLGVSWASDRLQKRKRFVWPPLLIASIAFYGSYALGSEHFWLSYALLVLAGACMYAPYGPFFAIVPEVLPANVAGGAMALINSMGALGSFSGSWLVGYLNGITGGPGAVLYKRLSAPLMERLRERVEVLLVEEPGRDGLARLRDALPEAHGLLGASLRLEAGLLDLAPRLEAIASVSVGVDNYDIDYLDRRGILLSNTPDVLTETTADTGFALILATARRVVELAGWVRAGEWKKSVGAAQFGTDVHGKTLGIVGMGRIGEALARRGHHGFGMRVLYHSHSPKPHVEERYAASYRSLDALLEESDFVCLTLPLTAATEGLIGAAQFARMRPQAIFINISRGRVVDEAALIEALAQRRIRAAGLDVFEREPLSPDSPLLRLPNVVATPHIGSATEETREAMARCAVDNLLAALAGERPLNLVNPSAWARRRGA